MLVLAQRSDLRAEAIDLLPLLDGMREVFSGLPELRGGVAP